MAYRIDDRWLWLGAGVALFIAVKGISYAIHDIVRLTEVQPLINEQDEEHQKQPEDSISLDVLRTLATSPNPNISKSAIDLITARCGKSSDLLASVQADGESSDPVLRRRARTALSFLGSWTLGGEIGNSVPPGMRTGGSTGALNLSPSMMSLDNTYEFDELNSLPPPRLRTHTFDYDGAEPPFDLNLANLAGSGGYEDDSEIERRRRRREAMVLHEGDGSLLEEDIIRPRRT